MTTETTPEKLIVKRRGRMFVLNMNEIVCIKSQNNYTKIMLLMTLIYHVQNA